MARSIESQDEVIGRGVYTVPQAARLVGAPSNKVRRWVFGLGGREPIIMADYPMLDGSRSLSFHDLIEARFIRAFRNAGVSFQHLRQVAMKAREEFGVGHPFASARFVTDGRRIILEQVDTDGRGDLTDYLSDQHTFADFIRRTILPGVEFDAKQLARSWRPWVETPLVVLDPLRAWGHPILDRTGTPTAVVVQAFAAEGSASRAAAVYELTSEEVGQAIAFEQRLAA